MYLPMNGGADAYCYTGGKDYDGHQPTVVFIHGAQNDHSVWALQSRYFAHHGYNVLALDLPGHGRSKGPALPSIEEMAGWVLGVMGELEVDMATLVGHSMGSLVALEIACIAPSRVSKLAMLGTACPMKVSDALLAGALSDEDGAIDMVNIWSHSALAQKPSPAVPGFHVVGGARRLMQRMARQGPAHLFHADFTACNAYGHGEAAAAAVQCPALLIFGTRDMMTPARSAKALTGALKHATVVHVDAGHDLMGEQPDAVLDALFAFAGASAGS